MELVGFDSALRGDLVALWNRVFADYRNARSMSESLWCERVEGALGGDVFEPHHLRVAVRGGRVCGFAHGGLWRGEFLARLVPQADPIRRQADALGYLALIAVDADVRRRGIGRDLLRDLQRELARETGGAFPLVADGRNYNPFYGNFFAPVPPLWGTTEGVAVPRGDGGTQAALQTLGFRIDATAQSVLLDPRTEPWLPRAVQGYERAVDGLEVVEAEDYQAILGSSGGSSYPFANESHCWVAVHEMVQIGALVAYPFEPSQTRWAIYSMEVSEEWRGRGVGRTLLTSALRRLRERGAREVEALVLPAESPGAHHLYGDLGFRSEAEWVVYA